MTARTAALADAIVLGLVSAFQVALLLGAPWGEYTQGGAVRGALSGTGRVLALGSALLLVAMALGVLARVGTGPLRGAPPRLIAVLVWFTAVYSGVGLVLNLLSQSAKERLLWAPVTLLILMLTTIVLRGTRGAGRSTAR